MIVEPTAILMWSGRPAASGLGMIIRGLVLFAIVGTAFGVVVTSAARTLGDSRPVACDAPTLTPPVDPATQPGDRE